MSGQVLNRDFIIDGQRYALAAGPIKPAEEVSCIVRVR